MYNKLQCYSFREDNLLEDLSLTRPAVEEAQTDFMYVAPATVSLFHEHFTAHKPPVSPLAASLCV